MNRTSQNGITIVALIVTVIIIIMLASVGIIQGTSIIKSAYLQNLNTNMLLIQGKAKIIYEHNLFNQEENPLIGINLSTPIEDEEINNKVNSLKESGIIEENSNYEEGEQFKDYYIWTQTELDSQELGNIKLDKGFYIINYVAEEVIYSEGFEYKDNNTYYKLSDTIDLR